MDKIMGNRCSRRSEEGKGKRRICGKSGRWEMELGPLTKCAEYANDPRHLFTSVEEVM